MLVDKFSDAIQEVAVPKIIKFLQNQDAGVLTRAIQATAKIFDVDLSNDILCSQARRGQIADLLRTAAEIIAKVSENRESRQTIDAPCPAKCICR